MPKQGMKPQSAMELLSTYSWALLIIALFVSTVFLLSGSKPPSSYLSSSCNIEPLLPCAQTLLTQYGGPSSPIHFIVAFTNELGVPISFAPNSINVTTTGIGVPGTEHSLGACTPSYATEGAHILCTANITGTVQPALGSQTSATFLISYDICKNPSSCTSGYKSTGISVQSASPPSRGIFKITLNTIPSTGDIVINGAKYINGTSVVLPIGKYLVYADAPNGYIFSSWTGSVFGTSLLSPSTTANATLSLVSNVTLEANFVKVISTTTTSVTSTSTSTSTTSTTTSSTTSTTT